MLPRRALHAPARAAARPRDGADRRGQVLHAPRRPADGQDDLGPVARRTTTTRASASGRVWVDLETAREQPDPAARVPHRAQQARHGRRAQRSPTSASPASRARLLDDPRRRVLRYLHDLVGPRTAPARRVLRRGRLPGGRGHGLVPHPAPRRLPRPPRTARSRTASRSSAQRDVRDYVVSQEERRAVAWLGTSSPFNVTAEATTLGPFTGHEVAELLGQHTAATGQRFEPEAVGAHLRAVPGPPLARQRPRRPHRRARPARPQRRRHRRARRGRQGGDHPGAPHAHRLARRTGCASRGCAGSSTRCSPASEPTDDVLDDDFAYVSASASLRARGGHVRDRQPHLPRGHPAGAHVRPADADRRRAARLRPRRRRARHAQAHGRLADLLAQGRAPRGRGLRLPGVRAAPDADGVPAAHRERRRPDRARVRARPRGARSDGRVARGAARRRGEAPARHRDGGRGARAGGALPRRDGARRGLAGDVRPALHAALGASGSRRARVEASGKRVHVVGC